jgi:glycogen(starch) synthase
MKSVVSQGPSQRWIHHRPSLSALPAAGGLPHPFRSRLAFDQPPDDFLALRPPKREPVFICMKILLTSRLYRPALGGTIVWTDSMADALRALGHQVRINLADTDELHRTSGVIGTCRNVLWSDAVLMIEPSIVYAAAAFAFRRPRIGSLHTWFLARPSDLNPVRRTQKAITHLFSRYAAPSRIIADDWGSGHPIIPNGYDPAIFFDRQLERQHDFIFVGRFNHDKGPDQFVAALEKLHRDGRQFSALMIGDGEKMEACRQIIRRSPGLEKKISFAGAITDRSEVARLMNHSKVLVVPNRWEEPFGMVFLEGLACGCRLVATNSGALQEISGGYARFVEKGNIDALADMMQAEALLPPQNSPATAAYLATYHWNKIAGQYLELLVRQQSA